MQKFFTINRFEHLESKKSIDSIIYNQYKIFVVFVRILHDENTTSSETHMKQLIESIYLYRKSKTKTFTKKFDDRAMNRKHAIKFTIKQNIIFYFYLLFIERWLTILKTYLIEYLNNDFIESFVFFLFLSSLKSSKKNFTKKKIKKNETFQK